MQPATEGSMSADPTVSRTSLQRLLRALRPHSRQLRLAALCSVLNKLFDLAPPVLIGLAVDVVVRQDNAWLALFGVTRVPAQLAVLAVLSFVIWSAESLFEYLYGLLWRNLAQTVQHELRLEAYGHLQQLEMAFFEAGSSGRLAAAQLQEQLEMAATSRDTWRGGTRRRGVPLRRHPRASDGAAAAARHDHHGGGSGLDRRGPGGW